MEKFTLDKKQSLLMVIDIQERLVPAMTVADQVIQNTSTLIATAKKLGMPIITTEQYPRGLGNTVLELKNQIDSNYLFEKNSFSAYTPDVKGVLESFNKRKIIIVGMETHICVFQTVRDLLSEGYQVFLARDGICSRTKENYKNGLALMANMGAVVTNTETILFDLIKEAGTPEFKVLSRLIK